MSELRKKRADRQRRESINPKVSSSKTAPPKGFIGSQIAPPAVQTCESIWPSSIQTAKEKSHPLNWYLKKNKPFCGMDLTRVRHLWFVFITIIWCGSNYRKHSLKPTVQVKFFPVSLK